MSAVQSSVPVTTPATTSTRLLDKYLLPKIALTVIFIASFVGTWLTMSTHGAGTWLQVGTRWLHLVSFAILAGGYMWKGLFARPAQKTAQQPYFVKFTTASFGRFRRLTRAALPLFVITAVYDLVRFNGWGVGWLVWFETVLIAMIFITVGFDVYRRRRVSNPFDAQSPARLILFLLLVDALVQAGFDVVLAQNGEIWPLLVRWLHLAAFGLWFGGAVWNIFITVPAARDTISLPVVIAASEQLARFRVAVRFILPMLIITGFIQATRYVGFDLNTLTTSTFGWLILTKMLLIGVLVLVFLTCPMWRACSPISGMCKLDDLYAKEHE